MKSPKLTEVFENKWEKKFDQILGKLAKKNGGKIPLTHVTTPEGWAGIQKSGRFEASEGTKGKGWGVYCTVGHLKQAAGARPTWSHGEDGDESVILHIDLPIDMIEDIKIDPNVQLDKGMDDYEAAIKILGPELKDCDVVVTRELPAAYVKDAIVHR